MMMDNSHFSYICDVIEHCDSYDDNYLDIFEKNIKALYIKDNIINNNVRNFVKNFKNAFENARVKEEEYLNPSYNVIFSFDYPKLSALFSLPLHIYMSGGLKFTDTSVVCFLYFTLNTYLISLRVVID